MECYEAVEVIVNGTYSSQIDVFWHIKDTLAQKSVLCGAIVAQKSASDRY